MTHDPEKAMSDGSLYGDCEPFTVKNRTEMAPQPNAGKRKKCRACDGTGFDNDYSTVRCSVCGGFGEEEQK